MSDKKCVMLNDDYAVLAFEGGEFYYGYEVISPGGDPEDPEWCFRARLGKREAPTASLTIPSSDLAPYLGKRFSQFEVVECLLAGIATCIERGWLVASPVQAPAAEKASSGERYCCHMDCGPGHPAEFEITGGSGHYEDVTDSCRGHVGEMLGTPAWLDRDNTHWDVYVIDEDPQGDPGKDKPAPSQRT